MIYLEKRIPEQNMYRYYYLTIQPDLFGEWVLRRSWGRIGQGGRTKEEWFVHQDSALEKYTLLLKQKINRGYQ